MKSLLIGLFGMLALLAIEQSMLREYLGLRVVRSAGEGVVQTVIGLVGDATFRVGGMYPTPQQSERLYRRVAELERQLAEYVVSDLRCHTESVTSQELARLIESNICVPSARKTNLLSATILQAGDWYVSAGSVDGVVENELVLKNGVVIGVVREAGEHSSMFDPLNKLRSPLRVLVQHPSTETHEGLLYARAGQVTLEYLEIDAEIHPESLVMSATSPTGFPIPIGALGRKISTDQDLHSAYQVVLAGSAQHRDIVSILIMQSQEEQ